MNGTSPALPIQASDLHVTQFVLWLGHWSSALSDETVRCMLNVLCGQGWQFLFLQLLFPLKRHVVGNKACVREWSKTSEM